MSKDSSKSKLILVPVVAIVLVLIIFGAFYLSDSPKNINETRSFIVGDVMLYAPPGYEINLEYSEFDHNQYAGLNNSEGDVEIFVDNTEEEDYEDDNVADYQQPEPIVLIPTTIEGVDGYLVDGVSFNDKFIVEYGKYNITFYGGYFELEDVLAVNQQLK